MSSDLEPSKKKPRLQEDGEETDCVSRVYEMSFTKGLAAVGKVNCRNFVILSSSEHSFGGYPVPNVCVSSGCPSLLLPITKKGDLRSKLVKLFPPSKNQWSVRESSGSKELALWIESINDMEIELCANLKLPASKFNVPFLRFHLCSEDIQEILKTPSIKKYLRPDDIQLLEKSAHEDIARADCALLGQLVMEKFTVLQWRGVLIMCKEQEAGEMVKNFFHIYRDVIALGKPEKFEELTAGNAVGIKQCKGGRRRYTYECGQHLYYWPEIVEDV